MAARPLAVLLSALLATPGAAEIRAITRPAAPIVDAKAATVLPVSLRLPSSPSVLELDVSLAPIAAPSPAMPALRALTAPASTTSTPPTPPASPGSFLFDGRKAGDDASPDGDATPESPPASTSHLDPPTRRFTHVRRFIGVGVPASVLTGAVGAMAPQVTMAAVHLLGQAAYWLANPFAFVFTMPQIHRILSRRSAHISPVMVSVGFAATVMATLNFAFDGKDLMMYRNIAQALGFATMLGLRWNYLRRPGRPLPTAKGALLETMVCAAVIAGLMFAFGPHLLAALHAAAWMQSLLVPSQIISGFGFTYLMYAQLSKMQRERQVGDSSPQMMWAYLGTKTIWIWSLATMLALSTSAPWTTVAAGAAFTALCWIAGRATLSRLLISRWNFIPETVNVRGRTVTRQHFGDVGAFLGLSSVILALSAVGYYGFIDLLGISSGDSNRFAMYVLYTVQSLVACLATIKSIRLSSSLDKENSSKR